MKNERLKQVQNTAAEIEELYKYPNAPTFTATELWTMACQVIDLDLKDSIVTTLENIGATLDRMEDQ